MNRFDLKLSLNLLVAFLSIALIIPAMTSPVWAQSDEDEEQVEEFIPQGIPPLSNRTAVLSFPLSVYPFNEPNTMPTIRIQELSQLTVVIEDLTEGKNSIDIVEDFLPLTTSAINSGVALYKESESKRGFNYSVDDQSKDLPIDLLEKPTVTPDPVVPGRYTITFKPISGSPNVQLPFFNDQFADFYVVVRTSLNLKQGDLFEAYIPANGIKIIQTGLVGSGSALPKDTLYDERFPGDYFADLNPDFTEPSIFEGDIVQIVNMISEVENNNRVDASSEPKTALGIDFVGREDVGYFVEEVRVNFLGLNLGSIARLIENLSQQGTGLAGMMASSQMGIMEQVGFYFNPTFFYSPWFYNAPFDMETGEPLTTIAPGDGETVMPLTMPLDTYGFPQMAFVLGADNQNHYTSYVSYGPREPGAYGLTPRVVTQDIFKAIQADSEGGVFLYRELGGTAGQYDAGVDHLINLDPDKFGVETFEVSPEAAADSSSPLNALMRRMLPASVGGDIGKNVIPWLYGDDNLGTALLGVSELPEASEEPRAPYGSLECTEDPDCYFFDLMINVLRPYMGLTEGQIRYLFEYTEGNGRTNSQDLFDYNLVQGFTVVLPVAKSNAISDLEAPISRTGSDAGSDIYVALRTSDNLRSLDAFIPFIQPKDIVIGTGVDDFTKDNLENVESLESVSSIGYGRENTSQTYAVIGRPSPRFIYKDLTQPGEGELASNNNILYDSTQSSPPKAVIGIDAQDFGQNPLLVNNHETIQYDVFDTFFTESAVFGEMQFDLIPGSRDTAFNPLLLSAVPLDVGISVEFSRIVTSHSIAIYYDDDTHSGNGMDDDGDGLIDEEWYNLQDDDGDGLIDEDIGDGNPAGINGVFDSMDHYLPSDLDRFGGVSAAYVFEPNSQTKFQDYIDAIQPEDDPLELVDGGVLPLSVSEGSYFAELDMRVLNMSSYSVPSSTIYPPRFFDISSTYNQGMLSWLEPRTGLIELIPMFRSRGGDFAMFPYYPEDLFIETADTGEIVWMITLSSEGDDSIPTMADPDGDVRRSFALSLNYGMRVPNPAKGFVRVGWTPMVVQVEGADNATASDPEGDSLTDVPYHQFGFDIELADYNTISDYVSGIVNTLSDAYDQARTTIEDYNEAVADAEADAADQEEPTEPEYPDIPDPQEISITDPYSGLNIDSFLDTVTYETNYTYLLQIPDENFGPLSGNDFYVVLRSSPEATVGESFRVRIRSGQRNAVLAVTDEETGDVTNVSRPEGGISYYSFLETNYPTTEDRYPGISKNQITTSEIFVQSSNVSPSLTFITPNSGLNVANDDFEFDITFTAEDPDNVAEIQLYVDTDSLNYDGQFIPGALLQEGYASMFQINLLEDVSDFDPTLQYYIYARLDDGVNQPVYVYADGPISTITSAGDAGGNGGGDGASGRVVTGDLDNPLDYIKLKSDGQIYSLGDAPTFTRIISTTDVVDLEVTPTFSGQIAVQANGQVIGGGDVGTIFSRYLEPDGSFSFPEGQTQFYRNGLAGGELIVDPTEAQITIEKARDVEVDFVNGAIYVLDGDGDMLFLGKANANLRPSPVGIDLYRDMELGPNGKQMYFLTGNGILSAVGDASIPSWSDLVEDDLYRDIELRVRGGAVTNLLLTDADGNIKVFGSDGGVKQTLESLEPQSEIRPGTVRQVKLFPDRDDVVMLVEGSGQPIFLTSDPELDAPSDRLIFSDEPGLDDDRIVDVETTSINLQSAVESVREIISAFSDESVSRIMALVSPNYKDRTGADAAALQASLTTFFRFYEVQDYAQNKLATDGFTIVNQGDAIVAQVVMDISLFYPQIFYYMPDVDSSSIVGESFGEQLFVDPQITFDQTITFREVSDGRGWMVDLYEIRNYGRYMSDYVDQEEFEYEDYSIVLGLTKNKRLTSYVPRKEGVDDPIQVFLDVNEENILEPYNVLAIFREPYLTRNSMPPAFEYTVYPGSILYMTEFDTVDFEFSRESDGSVKLTSMDLRIPISLNESQFLEVDATGATTENVLSQLDDLEVENISGFSFSRRGPVAAIFQGEADITMPEAETLQASYPLGGIMMLPENTNIYAIDPQSYVENNLTRSVVKSNPYDPDQDALLDSIPGMTSSYQVGRAYFVIAADGKHFGFIQIPEDALIDEDVETSLIPIDFRYENSFVLPDGF